jgi:hypothetical protein
MSQKLDGDGMRDNRSFAWSFTRFLKKFCVVYAVVVVFAISIETRQFRNRFPISNHRNWLIGGRCGQVGNQSDPKFREMERFRDMKSWALENVAINNPAI